MAVPTYVPTIAQNRSLSENQGTSASVNQSQQASQGSSASQSTSFIPNYSQTPILESIAKYAESMAPQVYQWGMDQYGKNQGSIDDLMRTADTYASGQRLSADMGMAESGVSQAGEKALQNSKQDLESYGIDPSSGRYAALDKAARVQTAAAAAGAGNQQRQADIATGNAMKNQAISSSLQNANFGLGVSGAMNDLLSTGIRLPYSPLGTASSSSSQNSSAGESSGQSASQNSGFSLGAPSGVGGSPASTRGGVNMNMPSRSGGDGGGSGGGSGGTGDARGSGPSYLAGFSGGSGSAGASGGASSSDYPSSSDGSSGYPDNGPVTTGWGNNSPGPDTSMPYQDPVSDPYSSGWNTGGIEGGDGSAYAEGGPVDDDQDQGFDPEQGQDNQRFVSPSLSPSGGQQTDDVPAQLNAGEFVLPDDVVKWKGEEFFQNLIGKSRQARESVMAAHGQMQGRAPQQGMNLGGAI